MMRILIPFGMVYLALFSLTYFRHDDWLILGNAATLAANWSAMWEAKLLVPHGEEIWFFRPFFKLGTFLAYAAFDLHYMAWLTATLAFTIGALTLGAATVRLICRDEIYGRLFLCLFVTAVPLHLGSLLWAGEGLMNCPLLFLLAANTWLLCGSVTASSHPRRDRLLAITAFILSLGFKESAIFHTAFLFGLVFSEAPFTARSLRGKCALLAPYAAVGTVYLAFRLLLLPVNEDYLASRGWALYARSLAYFMGTLGLPYVLVASYLTLTSRETLRQWLSALYTRAAYLPFLVLSLLPYLGHDFFSPGWLLQPGFFLLLILAFTCERIPLANRMIVSVGTSLFLIVLIPTVLHLHRLRWRHWHLAQRRIVSIVKTLPGDTEKIYINDCAPPGHPNDVTFERVVGHGESIFHLWKLIHGSRVKVVIQGCSLPSEAERPGMENTAHIQWRFPELIILKMPQKK